MCTVGIIILITHQLIILTIHYSTVLEREPKIGTRHLDLYRLYLRVCEEGGYDLVSDTKAKPLMWRTIAGDFLGKSPHLAAQAFMVKSAYYRNLVYVLWSSRLSYTITALPYSSRLSYTITALPYSISHH